MKNLLPSRNLELRMNLFDTVRTLGSATVLAALVGCATDPNRPSLTDHRQPGPAVGHAVGATVGAVGGNAVGAVVGVAEGAAVAAKFPFNNTRRVVRQWRQETTSDGRVIQVPVDIEVDAYGRPLTAAKSVSK
jgi:hypothetical protein